MNARLAGSLLGLLVGACAPAPPGEAVFAPRELEALNLGLPRGSAVDRVEIESTSWGCFGQPFAHSVTLHPGEPVRATVREYGLASEVGLEIELTQGEAKQLGDSVAQLRGLAPEDWLSRGRSETRFRWFVRGEAVAEELVEGGGCLPLLRFSRDAVVARTGPSVEHQLRRNPFARWLMEDGGIREGEVMTILRDARSMRDVLELGRPALAREALDRFEDRWLLEQPECVLDDANAARQILGTEPFDWS